MKELRRAGGAVFSFVAPDILRMEWSGKLEEDAIAALGDLSTELKASHGDLQMLLVHVHAAESISPAARKRVVDLSRADRWAATAIVGANFKIRVLIDLMYKAVRLVVSSASPMQFCDSDEQAMAWLAEQRAAHRA